MDSNAETKNNIDILIRELDPQEKDDDLTLIREISTNMSKVHKENIFQQYYPINREMTFQSTESLGDIDRKSLTNESLEEKFKLILNDKFNTNSPFFYLSSDQKHKFLSCLEIVRCNEMQVLYSKTDKIEGLYKGLWDAYILIEGEIHILNQNNEFLDLIDSTTFFGYDGPIFNKRFNTIVAEKGTILAKVSKEQFLDILKEVTQFNKFLSRAIIQKDKVLDNLLQLRNFILFSIDKGPVDMKELQNVYRKVYPCIHAGANSKEFDLDAWSYALNRLPKKVLETYVYVVMNKPPSILSTSDELILDLMPRVHSNLRKRDVIQNINGKNIIVLREMESDLIDFMTNMCIHIIEAKKIRNFITPLSLGKIYAHRDNVDKVADILRDLSIDERGFNSNQINQLKKMFGNELGINLIKLSMHYQNYSVNICKLPVNDIDPIENWTQNVWQQIRKILNLNSSVQEIDNLVVDIIQGSRKSMLNCLSPHIYKNKEVILKWAADNKIQTKTKKFNCPTDELIAYSYYYYEKFPEKAKEMEEMNRQHGIFMIKETFSTGVKVLIINTSQLDPNNIDPNINLKSKSKNHILLHIGYNFGGQSAQLIKPLFLLLNTKARSINIIGKAGGLVGQRSNILIANKMYKDSTSELSIINTGNIDLNKITEETKTNVYIGPMVTVSGTICQNYDLLNFYKNVKGCVGLDMEGFYFAKEVENAIKHEVLSKDFLTRCFYYVSDLPLDPTQVLSMEEGVVSWEEGVGSINAIQRFILNEICK